MTKERILRFAMYAAGIVCLAVFIIAKNESLIEAVTSNMFEYGDLYRFTKVREFRVPLPPSATDFGEHDEYEPDPDTTSVVVIGDSYLESDRGHKRFAELLADRLHTPVAPVYAGYAPAYFDPVYFFWENQLDTSTHRIVLLERVERYMMNNYLRPSAEDSAAFVRINKAGQRSWYATIEDRWFTGAERNYEVVVSGNAVTFPILEFWNTLRFNIFGLISDETPLYSLHPPFLFYKEETNRGTVTSFYYPHPDTLLDRLADNIARMRNVLKTEYNAELVFMPIPDAYTLYHTMINNDPYDRYLPRLCRKLEQRGVRTVKLFEPYSVSSEILYLPTDTHWNAKGATIAADEAAKVLRSGGL